MPDISRRTALAGAALALPGCASVGEVSDETGRVAVDGLMAAYRRRTGRGPVVVFESGLGDGLDVWAATIDALEPNQAFVAYSRPGYGDSDGDGDEVRASDEAARRLHATLHALSARPPYVLVGHSLGGLYIAKFAELYPDTTAGLVFVDGRPPRFRALCADRGVSFCDGSRARQPAPDWPLHLVAETAGVAPSETMAPPDGVLARIPATVITSTNVWPGEGGAAGFELWLESQAAFAGGFLRHRLVRAEGAGHYVQRDQPALVAREITTMIAGRQY